MSVYKKSKLLKSHRVEKGFSREKLSEGICDSTTLKRYENEGMIPSDDNYRMLQEKMGGRPEQIIMSSDMGLFIDIDRYQEYEELLVNHKYEELKMMMKMLKDSLKTVNSVEKEQFIGRLELIKYNEYTKESFVEFERMIKLSVPDYKDGVFSVTRLYNDTELYLFNDLALNYYELGNLEKADEVFQRLDTYFDQAEDLKDSIVAVKILFNYSNLLGKSGNYEKAISICKKAIALLKNNSCQEMLYTFIFNIGWLYDQMWEKSHEDSYKSKAKEYIELSLVLAKFFNESPVNTDTIEGYYNERFL